MSARSTSAGQSAKPGVATGPSRPRPSWGLAATAAFALTAATALISIEEPASAAELVEDQGFSEAFADFGFPESLNLPSTADDFDPAAAEAAAPSAEEATEQRDLGVGKASYYGARFAGRRTASGERFDPTRLTAAHRTLPFGSRVKVTNRRNGKSVVVRINDRGPFHPHRVIDLSRRAAERIGLVRRGQGLVELTLLSS